MASDDASPAGSGNSAVPRSPDAATGTAPVSELAGLAARSFATVNEAIDATLALMRRLLDMEVRMVNQVDGDRHRFARLQLPADMPNLEGLSTPLNHNF